VAFPGSKDFALAMDKTLMAEMFTSHLVPAILATSCATRTKIVLAMRLELESILIAASFMFLLTVAWDSTKTVATRSAL
jgi:hypothetical protein